MHSSEPSQRWPSVRGLTLKVLCFRSICVLYSTLCLAVLPNPSEAGRLRCGSDLLADLIFVCGDRGFYLGKGNWSGYGARPRGKGIVDHCCQPAGCDLLHLETYCAKPKSRDRRHTTAYPTTAQPTTPQQVMAEQFQTVFQKRLLDHMGTPNSEKRQSLRMKPHNSHRRRTKGSSSSKRIHMAQSTGTPPVTSQNPPGGTTHPL